MDFEKNNRMYSLLGQRGTFGVVLNEMAKENDSIVGISADLTKTSGLDRFATNFPQRFYNVGIAEQNAVAFAAGLADQGRNPFVCTFSNFATLRSNEFIRHFMAYMGCGVKVVGLGSGFAMGLFGNTHYAIEDISVIRSMPNITILSPCDCMEVAKCVEFCSQYDGPVYLRLSGKNNNPVVNKRDYSLRIGKGIVCSEGDDIILYATGSMVSVALNVAKLLENRGIHAKVINIHTIKPIDKQLIMDNKDYPIIVTMEEHSVLGGLGTAISETLAQCSYHGRVLCMGVEGNYKNPGTYEYMMEQNGLTEDKIFERIIEELDA